MLSESLRDYFLKLVESEQSPAFLVVDRAGQLLDFGGATAAYGLTGLERGRECFGQCPFLVGLLPLSGEPLELLEIEVGGGRSARVNLIPDPRGDIVLLRDVSREVSAIRDVQQAANELTLVRAEQAELIADLNAFAHTVAHDLRDPLTAVIGYAELVMMDESNGALSAGQRRELQEIIDSGQRMSRIIEELLLLAGVRTSTVALHELKMAAVVASALERLKSRIRQSNAQVLVVKEWPGVMGYGPWVEEVWANYISNAIKYGGDPPRLTLGAEAPAGGPPKFWVEDNGRGVAPEMREHLFTAHAGLGSVRAKGHGLGLSIVRRIVEKLGGEVGVSDAPGGGSRFYFTLPAPSARVD